MVKSQDYVCAMCVWYDGFLKCEAKVLCVHWELKGGGLVCGAL